MKRLNVHVCSPLSQAGWICIWLTFVLYEKNQVPDQLIASRGLFVHICQDPNTVDITVEIFKTTLLHLTRFVYVSQGVT